MGIKELNALLRQLGWKCRWDWHCFHPAMLCNWGGCAEDQQHEYARTPYPRFLQIFIGVEWEGYYIVPKMKIRANMQGPMSKCKLWEYEVNCPHDSPNWLVWDNYDKDASEFYDNCILR